MSKPRSAQNDNNPTSKRNGHRGWLIFNVSTDQVVRCIPSPFSAEKLAAYPNPLHWPTYGDLTGAKALVSAVMDKDARSIERMAANFPEHDFGLGEWGKELKRELVRETAQKRRILRQRTLPNGRKLCLEVVTDTDSGKRRIVGSFYRGRTRLAEKTIRQEA